MTEENEITEKDCQFGGDIVVNFKVDLSDDNMKWLVQLEKYAKKNGLSIGDAAKKAIKFFLARKDYA